MADRIQHCGYCGAELTDGIPVCPRCGRDNSVPMLGGKKSGYSGRRKAVQEKTDNDYQDEYEDRREAERSDGREDNGAVEKLSEGRKDRTESVESPEEDPASPVYGPDDGIEEQEEKPVRAKKKKKRKSSTEAGRETRKKSRSSAGKDTGRKNRKRTARDEEYDEDSYDDSEE